MTTSTKTTFHSEELIRRRLIEDVCRFQDGAFQTLVDSGVGTRLSATIVTAAFECAYIMGFARLSVCAGRRKKDAENFLYEQFVDRTRGTFDSAWEHIESIIESMEDKNE